MTGELTGGVSGHLGVTPWTPADVAQGSTRVGAIRRTVCVGGGGRRGDEEPSMTGPAQGVARHRSRGPSAQRHCMHGPEALGTKSPSANRCPPRTQPCWWWLSP
ncbi:hypothetical protein MRX96_033690 [Rhipicephalus microplus]